MSVAHVEWDSVPSVCRRIAALLAVACLGVASTAPIVHAQSAGDQQYSDPFAGSGGGAKKQQKSTSTADGNQLSPTPQTPTAKAPSTSGGGSSPSSASSAPQTLTATKPSESALPNTGVDARVLLVVGTVLLLTGLGLRLRSAPERF